MQPQTILIVEDDEVARENLSHILGKVGYDILAVSSGAKALELLENREFDLVLTDLKMPQVDGMQVLAKSRELHPHTEVVMITGYATVDSAVESMRQGAYHYLAKPYKIDLVRKVVGEALLKRSLYLENQSLKQTLAGCVDRPQLIGNSKAMRKVTHLLEQAAPSDSNVLIMGETGTGKELAARTIHQLSGRRDHPFVAFNCGAFSEELLSNELFGHEKDAFTGATTQRVGLIETAEKGTVFLDEIGDMPLNMQLKLLRVIEEKEVLRVGATRPVPVDARFVAATARDLNSESANGRFRSDLYYRLNVINIVLPPLVDRTEDIPLLVQHFLARKGRQSGKEITAVAPEVLDVLNQYSWPGNVRELENVIERAVVMAQGSTIGLTDLPEDLLQFSVQTFRRTTKAEMPSLEQLEGQYIRWVLQKTGWNKTQAAQILGIDRVSLWRKVKRHGLEAEGSE
jgi:DNA-binding NtrC family response regulator